MSKSFRSRLQMPLARQFFLVANKTRSAKSNWASSSTLTMQVEVAILSKVELVRTRSLTTTQSRTLLNNSRCWFSNSKDSITCRLVGSHKAKLATCLTHQFLPMRSTLNSRILSSWPSRMALTMEPSASRWISKRRNEYREWHAQSHPDIPLCSLLI